MAAFQFNFFSDDKLSQVESSGGDCAETSIDNLASTISAAETFPNVDSFVEAQPLHISNLKFLTAIPRREALPKGDFVKIVSKVDVKTGIYEGGLKVWECSIDLVEYMNSSGTVLNGLDVLEAGCGHGLPGLFALASGARVCFQDYNSEVLDVVTAPNVWLNVGDYGSEPPPLLETVWRRVAANAAVEPIFESNSSTITSTATSTTSFHNSSVASVASLSTAPSAAAARYFCGDWSQLPACLATAGAGRSSSPSSCVCFDLVLSAETLYTAESCRGFAKLLLEVLPRSGQPGKALVAAKRFYFGTGGGVEEFQRVLSELCDKAGRPAPTITTVLAVDDGSSNIREILEVILPTKAGSELKE